jgi:hypothetical protein
MELTTPLNGGRWPSLTDALLLAGCEPFAENRHRAHADAVNCLALLRGLASK